LVALDAELAASEQNIADIEAIVGGGIEGNPGPISGIGGVGALIVRASGAIIVVIIIRA